jgi:hypothetical protein
MMAGRHGRAQAICRTVAATVAVLYAVALGLFAIGAWGLFGQPRDPLAAVFLLPLGLPWNRMLDPFPAAWVPWLVAAAPIVNLAILATLCRVIRKRQAD